MPLLALNCVSCVFVQNHRVFLCKIKYLAKLLVGGSKSISSRVFVSATIADPVNVSLKVKKKVSNETKRM